MRGQAQRGTTTNGWKMRDAVAKQSGPAPAPEKHHLRASLLQQCKQWSITACSPRSPLPSGAAAGAAPAPARADLPHPGSRQFRRSLRKGQPRGGKGQRMHVNSAKPRQPVAACELLLYLGWSARMLLGRPCIHTRPQQPQHAHHAALSTRYANLPSPRLRSPVSCARQLGRHSGSVRVRAVRLLRRASGAYSCASQPMSMSVSCCRWRRKPSWRGGRPGRESFSG